MEDCEVLFLFLKRVSGLHKVKLEKVIHRVHKSDTSKFLSGVFCV